jgi:outer membrane protein insertion porin family
LSTSSGVFPCTRWRGAVLAIVFAVAAAPRTEARDVQDFLGRPVGSVRLQLEGRDIDDAALLDLVDTRVGEPLRMTDVRETMEHLHGLGRFQDVQVHADLAAAGSVALRYDLIPLHTVRAVGFRGQLGLSEQTLRDFVQDRFGSTPSVGRAAEAARALTSLLHDRGFVAGQVTPEPIVQHDPDRTTLFFNVASGVRTRIREVVVNGREPPGVRTLRQRGAFQAGEPLDRIRIQADLESYVADVKARGYYQARADFVARADEGEPLAQVEVTVDAGPRISVAFQGDPIPSKQRNELVPVLKEHSVDEDLLEDSRARIESSFQAQGYKDAAAPYAWKGDEQAAERQLVFTVTKGRQYRVQEVELVGNAAVSTRDLLPFVTVARGQPYVESSVAGDKARIVEEYRRRGYVDAKVQHVTVGGTQSGVEPQVVPLTVRIQIAEGARALVRTVGFMGNTAFGEAELSADVKVKPGRPFYDPEIAGDRDAITLKYLNAGYPTATVEPQVAFSADRTQADVRFAIREGAQVFIDHIMIVGNNRTSAKLIGDQLTLKVGKPLGYNDLVESQQRVSALGLFRRARITDLEHSGDPVHRDVLVSVEEAPLTTYGFGGGLEGGQQLRRASGGGTQGQAEQVFQIAPRGFFEIGRRNLWGKNRTVNLFTRLTLRPRNATSTTDSNASQGRYGFNEYRVLGTLREPKLLGTEADGLVTAFIEQAVRSSFNFSRRAVQAEAARRIGPGLSVIGRYSFERARIFDPRYNESEKPQIDRFFPQVRLSSFSSTFVRDTRDDALDPSRGMFTSLETAIAARVVGSEVGFLRSFIQTFVFRPLPTRRRIIFAGAARLGLGRGFPKEVVVLDEAGNPVPGPDGQPVTATVRDIPASERFFAGGATTVRGFALDRLGTPDIIDSDGFSKGGDALLVLNAELRVAVTRDIGVAGFLDAGNVFPRTADLRFGEIRPASGLGLRYKSPLGPLRFDVAFNLSRRFAGEKLESPRQYWITLGQAF